MMPSVKETLEQLCEGQKPRNPLGLAGQSSEALNRLHREGFLSKRELTLELQRRQSERNEQNDPIVSRQARVAVRDGNRVAIDVREYELILTMLGVTKTLMPVLEQRGLPVADPEKWRILHDGFEELQLYFRWSGDSGIENQIADLLEMRDDLADG